MSAAAARRKALPAAAATWIALCAALPAAAAARAQWASVAQSTHWSGYVQAGTAITGASAQWQLPSGRISGRAEAQMAAWVGIGGWGSEAQNHNIVQVGTIAIVEAGGRVDQRVWYELDPPPHYVLTNVLVHAGDRIAASVRLVAKNRWRLSLRDLTNGHSFTLTHRFHSLEGSAEAVVEDPYNNGESSPYSSEAFPFPHFGPVRFHALQLRTGSAWQDFSAGRAEAIRLIQNGHLLAEPTALVGDGFTVNERR